MTPVNVKQRADFLAGAGEMGTRIRAFDWTSTPLGAIDLWPQSLKTSVSLILTSRHPMWIGWGPQMTFLYNEAYLHVLGPAKHPWALGRPASEVWAEIWDVCGPLANKVFEDGEASFVDARLFMNRGDFLEETFYSFSYSPIRDEFGQVSGLFCPSTDVTPKVLNARRLRILSELSGNAMLEKTTTGVCAITARTLAKNPDDIPFALLYLADAKGNCGFLEQLVGSFENQDAKVATVDLTCTSDVSIWPIAEVFRTAQRQTVSIRNIPGLMRGVADQPVSHAVVLPVTLSGEHQPYGVLVTGVNPGRPLDEEHLTFFDLLAGQVATAIQNARAVEEEKNRADMLAEIDRAKTVFFSNVSHEFRTPLTLMLGPIESLLSRSENLKPEQHDNLVIAHRNSLRLLKLVNSLLDFSRIEAGRFKAFYRPTNLSSLTADLASNFQSIMQEAGLKLIIDCPPLSEPIYVDHEMWEKIILNLLSNAFKFTFEGSVAVRLHSIDSQAVLTISDTGTGISKTELPKIFDRFHRIEGAKGRTYEGTGIGLALIQELVRLHAGSISANSEPGQGSTFTVTIPFGTAHLPRERVEAAPAAQIATVGRAQAYTGDDLTWLSGRAPGINTAAGEHRPATGTRSRILIADDNADMREHVARTLGQDYELVFAKDGQEALEQIRQHPPDLLLTDVMMPGLDGFELLRAVRSGEATRTLPVIFISARAGEEMRVEGLQAGADDYLVKPFTANELRARVSTHVQMAIARRNATEKEVALRAEAEAARDEAETLNEVSRSLAGELDLEKLVQIVTDAATRLTNAQFGAFFYNLLNDKGESYVLYTLSGAPREAFAKFDLPRNTPIFEPTFRGTRVIRSDDILADSNYGKNPPHRGMPAGHLPVRSYLAVPVVSRSGEVLGGLFFGHSETAIFTERAERIASGIASYAAIAVDNAQLFAKAEQEITRRNQVEKALRQSEERFRGVFESSAVGVAVMTLDQRFLEVNEAFCSITGYSEPELHGLNYDRLTHPDDRREVERLLRQLISGEISTFALEQRYFTKSRRTIWVQNSVSAMRDAAGHAEHIIALCEDVTARTQAETALRDSEERYRAIVETTPECVKVVAADGTLLHMNPPGLVMVGADSAEEVIGKSIYGLIAPEFLDTFRDFNERICRGERGSLQFDIINMQGQRLQMETHSAPLRNPDGTVVQLAISRDITERKRAERATHLLGAIVDSSDDAIISKNLTGIITSWNRGAERLFGYTTEEVTGKSITILLPEERLSEEQDILRRIQAGERVEHFETIRRRKDGSLFDVSLTISPVRDARGTIIGASKIARDITERKRAEAALLASETRFRQLADSMPQMVWTARSDGYVDYYNNRWYEFTGFDRGIFGDISWEPILHPEDLKCCNETWYASVKTGQSYRIEYRFWDRHENRWRWFMGRALPVYDDQGQIVKWFGTCTDIDEQKRVQEELRHANHDLEQFAYSASHDLQEPLRGVKIYSEVLTKRYGPKLDGQALEFLHYLRVSASRMEMLVRDLLSYTQVTKLEVSEKSSDANEALTETLANLNGAIMESGARITSDPLPAVRLHYTHLKQLLQNLIANAVKYRSPDRVPTVHVSAECREAEWVFSVTDNGIGIEPQYKERIFGLFKRLHTGDEYSGTGIGLAICQRIVERYHGRIWVESKPGQGSNFKFTIPV